MRISSMLLLLYMNEIRSHNKERKGCWPAGGGFCSGA
jgi:hypothetical protein